MVKIATPCTYLSQLGKLLIPRYFFMDKGGVYLAQFLHHALVFLMTKQPEYNIKTN